MKNLKFSQVTVSRIVLTLIAAGAMAAQAGASDPEGGKKKWQLDSGLDRAAFRALVEERKEAGMRLVDFELYRVSRNTQISAIWVEAGKNDKWEMVDGVDVDAFRERNDYHTRRGYSITELEIDRVGATLEFTAIWTKSAQPLETHGYFGMDDLLFSNRYGEMADNGFRLIDFEPYNANGRIFYAAIWAKRTDEEVRFYRGLTEEQFASIAQTRDEDGFRLIDIEVYLDIEDNPTFAGEWVKRAKNQKSEYGVSIPVGEFFKRNAELTQQGYRLTEVDMFEYRDEIRYSGSWLRDLTEAEMPKPEKGSFLDEFRK